MSILDLLFPKTCAGCGKLGVYFCEACSLRFPLASPICPMCFRGSIGGLAHARCRRPLGMDGLLGLFSYRDGVKTAVKRLKYRFVKDMVEACVSLTLARLAPEMRSFFRGERFRVVPVPLHRSRERWRGFNQARLLGQLLADRLGLDYVEPLARVRGTQSLAELRVRLSAEELEELDVRYPSVTQRMLAQRKLLRGKQQVAREAEMRGAFQISSKFKVKSSKLLLVDDVWTSGATMTECAKILKRKGAASVWGFTFARGGR